MVLTMSQRLKPGTLRLQQSHPIEVSFSHWGGWLARMSLVGYLIKIRRMVQKNTVIGWLSYLVIDM